MTKKSQAAAKAQRNKKQPIKFNPVYTVDLTNCETVDDVTLEFAYAKFNAGLSLNTNEVCAIVNDEVNVAVGEAIDDLFGEHNALVKDENGEIEALDAYPAEQEKPWYKKLFGWFK